MAAKGWQRRGPSRYKGQHPRAEQHCAWASTPTVVYMCMSRLHQLQDFGRRHALHPSEDQVERHRIAGGPLKHSLRRGHHAVIEQAHFPLVRGVALEVYERLRRTTNSKQRNRDECSVGCLFVSKHPVNQFRSKRKIPTPPDVQGARDQLAGAPFERSVITKNATGPSAARTRAHRPSFDRRHRPTRRNHSQAPRPGPHLTRTCPPPPFPVPSAINASNTCTACASGINALPAQVTPDPPMYFPTSVPGGSPQLPELYFCGIVPAHRSAFVP